MGLEIVMKIHSFLDFILCKERCIDDECVCVCRALGGDLICGFVGGGLSGVNGGDLTGFNV